MGELLSVSVVAGVAVRRDGKYLLVQEEKEEVRGLWNWPAGRLDEGETFEEAAIRETREEANVVVGIIRRVGVFHYIETKPVQHLFLGQIMSGEPAPGEAMAIGWFSAEEIRAMERAQQLRSPWVREGMELIETEGGI